MKRLYDKCRPARAGDCAICGEHAERKCASCGSDECCPSCCCSSTGDEVAAREALSARRRRPPARLEPEAQEPARPGAPERTSEDIIREFAREEAESVGGS